MLEGANLKINNRHSFEEMMGTLLKKVSVCWNPHLKQEALRKVNIGPK